MASTILNRREKFAQALALGSAPSDAWVEAGYTHFPPRARRRAERPDVASRVAEIQQERALKAWDLVPVIEQLMALATAAGNLGTAAGMREARGLLAEAGKLKSLAPHPEPTVYPRLPDLTTEEWIKAFGPTR
jgi:hypothetical protein